MSPKQPSGVFAFGRALRILLGIVLIIYVAPVYFRVPRQVIIGSLLLVLGLAGVYCLLFLVSVRRVLPVSSWLVTIIGQALLIAVYAAGFFRLPILGGGKGQLAAITFLAISLVVAGMRALSGCELMAIPSIFFENEAELPCLIFSPLDKLERKLRAKRGV